MLGIILQSHALQPHALIIFHPKTLSKYNLHFFFEKIKSKFFMIHLILWLLKSFPI